MLEKRGTVIVNTEEKALYHIIGRKPPSATAWRWTGSRAGIAKVGRKVEWPTWTPPASMIRRRPDLEKCADPAGGKNPAGREGHIFV